MQAYRVRPGCGWRWVIEGFRILGTRPLAILGLTVLFLFTVILPTVFPVIGGFAPLLLTPGLAVGFMAAVRTVSVGKMPSPWILYSGFTDHGGQGWKPLLILGAMNATLTGLVLMLTVLADGGTLLRLATGAIDPNDGAVQDVSLAYAGAVFLLLYLPVQMAMWYAPVFVGWHRVPPAKALFFSFVAVWRNKAAFIVYGIGWMLVAVTLSMALQVLRAALPEGVMPIVMSPVSLAMLGALYCSFWPSYRDVVVEAELPATEQPTTE
jgi:hypothetical protein